MPIVPTEVGYIKKDEPVKWVDHYYMTMLADPIFDLEKTLGYDPVLRMAFRIPFLSYDEEILEETEEYTVKRDIDGWIRKYYKGRDLLQQFSQLYLMRSPGSATRLIHWRHTKKIVRMRRCMQHMINIMRSVRVGNTRFVSG